MTAEQRKRGLPFTPRGFTARGDLTGARSPPKSAPKRTHQFTNTSSELTGNSNYAVSKLTAMPNVLQTSMTPSFTGTVNESTSHALLASDQSVYIWKYNSNDAIPATTQLQVAPLNNGFPPIALLISPSAGSTEPGVVVINSHTGHIRFYENIESASAVGLLHQRHGLEFHLRLADREFITIAESIEPAGVLMSTTTGRVILLSLRNSAGKASLSTSEIIHRQASFFSSSVAHQKQMAAIKAGSVVAQGERIAATVTRGGFFQVRTCARDGQSKVILEQDLSEILIEHIAQDTRYQGIDLVKKLEIVDMALLPHFEPQDVFLLLAALEVSPDYTAYIQFVIRREQNHLLLFSAYRLQTFTKPYKSTPRLFVPAPGTTAFILFDHAVVLAQLPTQLDHEINNMFKKWEDIITFKSDVNIIGYGSEDLKKVDGEILQYPSIHVMIPQAGVLRVERLQSSETNAYVSTSMLKTHIEQAVFYGDAGSDTLEFDMPNDIVIDHTELKTDLLAVAGEIITSTSTYIPARLSSLESHLELRRTKAEKLLRYAAANFKNILDIDTKISLVSSYEKISAALGLRKTLSKFEKDSTLNNVFAESVAAYRSDLAAPSDLYLVGLNGLSNFIAIFLKKISDTRGLESTAAEITTSIFSNILSAEKEFRYDLLEIDGTETGQAEPWFATNELYVVVNELFQKFVEIKSTTTIDEDMRQMSVAFAEILFYTLQQKIGWLKNKRSKTRADQEDLEKAQSFYNSRSGTWTRNLVIFGAKAEAVAIADTYRDLKSLVEISDNDRENADEMELTTIQLCFDHFFSKFGYDFAETLYNYYIQTGKYEVLLFGFPQYDDYLQKFFSENNHGRISWVKDILDQNYNKASSVLFTVTKETDDQQSHRHLQLSIAKLAALADMSADDELLQDIQEELDFVEAQEGIINQISAFVRSDTDPAAQVSAVVADLLTTPYKSVTPSINKDVFQRAMSRLLSNKSLSVNELVDAYTLLDSKVTSDKNNCFCALKVLHLADQSEAVKVVNEKLTWRRAILSDDWLEILSNETKTAEFLKELAEDTVLFQTLVQYFKDELFVKNNDHQISLPDVHTLTAMDSDADLLARYTYLGSNDLVQLKKELQEEIDQIKALVSEFRLEDWIQGLIGTANSVSGAERTIDYSKLTIKDA